MLLQGSSTWAALGSSEEWGWGPQRCVGRELPPRGMRGSATSSVSGVRATSAVVSRASCAHHPGSQAESLQLSCHLVRSCSLPAGHASADPIDRHYLAVSYHCALAAAHHVLLLKSLVMKSADCFEVASRESIRVAKCP